MPCRACGADTGGADLLHVTTNRGRHRQWKQCGACGSFTADSDGPVSEDQLEFLRGTEYGAVANAASYNAAKDALYRAVLAEFDPVAQRVLDVGCSFGGFVRVATDAGLEAEGVDVNPDCVAYASAAGLRARVCTTLADISESGTFDVVAMIDVSYLFDDQRREFEEALRLLRPNGQLVLRTTNKHWLARLGARFPSRRVGQRLFERAALSHGIVQSPASLRRLLLDVGFRDVAFRPDLSQVATVNSDSRLVYQLSRAVFAMTGRVGPAPGVIVAARA